MFEEDTKEYNLFISHINKEDPEQDVFFIKLNASYDFQWKDCAVRGEVSTPELTQQMEKVDVVVILSGLISKQEALIKDQIDVAVKLKKPIVVIRPYGMENVPYQLEEIADEVVGWNTPCIVDAIREAYENKD
ncbi:MAG: hypothetical protein LLF83_00250 [Methanobacterium sp.]|nr:hypothetical protein [Methanobacterium sp.]